MGDNLYQYTRTGKKSLLVLYSNVTKTAGVSGKAEQLTGEILNGSIVYVLFLFLDL